MRVLHIHRALLRCISGFGLLASMASAQSQSNLAKQIESSACPRSPRPSCNLTHDFTKPVGSPAVQDTPPSLGHAARAAWQRHPSDGGSRRRDTTGVAQIRVPVLG